MGLTLALDVYGTLVDTSGVIKKLAGMVGPEAANFSDTWRNKQLEYSFRRGLMKDYVKFSVCTRQALEFTDQLFGSGLSSDQKDALMKQYLCLPAFPDAIDALKQLGSSGHKLYAFSNGDPVSVDTVLNAAGIRDYFIDIISVDDLSTFKPNPAVYEYFLEKTGAQGKDSWLISSNPFDVLGALNTGMKAAWIKRSDKIIFDPWDWDPVVTVKTLTEYSSFLGQFSG
jgi:2-haloacid dehalogenase